MSGGDSQGSRRPGGDRLMKSDAGERPGGRIGRYVVVSRLGQGAMGMVYLTYDPQLDRRVALKVLRRRRSTRASHDRQQRLRREAQAMAQLNHPNVVTVHDVGVAEGRVFLAMDYVQGQTLRQWLESTPRTWNQVLRVMINAGRGLAAAHAAGVVHRDFKPENVLVGEDGAVKVMDFGLARPGSDAASGAIDARDLRADDPPERAPTMASATIDPAPDDPAGQDEDDDGTHSWWKGESGLISLDGTEVLTRSGDVLGTPSYMAPELFDGGEANTHTDQFALCVALYEGLYGVRPFAGESMAALAFNMNRGQITAPARGVRVPVWLGRLVRRGLSAEPERRYASVQALLDALIQGAGRRRVRRAGMWAMGLVGVVGGLSYAVVPQPAPCQGGQERLRGVWNDDRADTIADAFEATEVPYADKVSSRARQRVDAYAQTWVGVYTEVCEATAVHGNQSPAELDQRIACLDDRLAELDALLEVLEEADGRVAERAAQAASDLRAPDTCASAGLEARPTSADPEHQRQLDTLRGRLLRAEALQSAGHMEDAATLSREIVAEAELLGERSLWAEALIQLGTATDQAGDYEAATEQLRRAYFIAHEAGLDTLAGQAAVNLIISEGIHLARADEGLTWARHAEAVLNREQLGGLEARYHSALGKLYMQRFELPKARSHLETALALERQALGDEHERVASVLSFLAIVQEQSGESEGAIASFEQALLVHRRALGPKHPALSQMYNNYGALLWGRRDLAGAQSQLEKALAIQREAMGEHPATATSIDNLGSTMVMRGEVEGGRALIEEALAMRERVLGADHPEVARSLLNLGDVLHTGDDLGGARRLYERAMSIWDRSGMPNSPMVAQIAAALGTLALREGAIQRGHDHCKRAVEILDPMVGPQHSEQAGPLTCLGWAQLELEQPQAALATLERAYSLRDAGQFDVPALVRVLLAQALVQTGGDTRRADTLRAEARKLYRSMTQRPPQRVRAWLQPTP